MTFITDYESQLDENLTQTIREAWQRILDTREEILQAFVAKYGLQPDEVVMVERRTSTGSQWWVERRALLPS